MTPEGIAWQILKSQDRGLPTTGATHFQPGQRGRAAKIMSEDEMLEEAKERAHHQPIGKHTYEDAVKMYLYRIRRDAERQLQQRQEAMRMLGQEMAYDEEEQAQQKPVDSEFDNPEEDNLAQQRQPGM